MHTLNIVVTLTLKLLSTSLSLKQLLAIILLGALLIPLAAPVPALAHSLAAESTSDNASLTLPGPTFLTFMSEVAGSVFSGVFALIFSSKENRNNPEYSHGRSVLESRVKSFQTQLQPAQIINVGQTLSLAALPLDKNGNIINGLVPKWKTSNPQIISVVKESEALALKEGEAVLSVVAGKVEKSFSVSVVGSKPLPGNAGVKYGRNNTAGPASPLMEPTDLAVIDSLFTPANNLGNPPGQVEISSRTVAAATQTEERAGAANFSFGFPVVSLPGRGMNTSIGVTYNSRVWNKINNGTDFTYNFNVDRNWLAPGFSIGFGHLDRFIIDGSEPSDYVYSYSLVDPDGTRHQLAYKGTDESVRHYESTDGTFIRINILSLVEHSVSMMDVSYPDGTIVTYGALKPETWQGNPDQGRRFPIKITDRQGNYISIDYTPNDITGKIATITDTMGRYINFHYSGAELASITAPGYNNSSNPRYAAYFYYDTITLDTSTTRFYNGPVSPALPSSIKVLKYVYFPGTQSGFKYDYSSAWGMVYKVSSLRGMTASSSGVSGEGEVAATTTYNYPLTLGAALDDVPTFTTRTDDWLGRTTSQAPVTNFSFAKDTTNNRTVTKITDPDGTISETWAKMTNSWDNGLVTDTFIKTVLDPVAQTYQVWNHTKLFWNEQTSGGGAGVGRRNSHVEKVEDTNDANETKATTFEYDDYNNPTVVKEYGFASPGSLGAELRKTQTTYQTNSGWLRNNLLHLPASVKTIVSNTTVSRTDYEYDNDDLALYGSDGVVQHDPRYNPDSSTREVCMEACPEDCINRDSPACTCDLKMHCEYQAFDDSTYYRGNVTKVTSFVDPDNSSDPNASVSTMKYDIAGNMVQASVNCCNVKTIEYSPGNAYAYATKETRGSDTQLITEASYDFNTGLLMSATSENDQDTTFTYDSNSLLQTRSDQPNGGWATSEYNLTAFPYNTKITRSLDSARSVSGWTFFNGIGQQFRARKLTANGYVSSDAEFDNMHKTVRAYNPYTVSSLTTARPSGIKYIEVTQTDGLSRILQTTLEDNTTVSAEYNGRFTTITDQGGKKRRQMTDALGRLVRLDEPDSSGSLGTTGSPAQPTIYEYDGNDNLKRIAQTAGSTTQERLFKYDALSRLRWEKEAEAIPDLNDAGQKVGSGGLWTAVYNYNTHNLLTDATDARGVKTTFTYDGLNRVSAMAYTGESGYQTPGVAYTYDQQHTNYYNKGQLTKVETAAVSTSGQSTPATVENYDYDKIGQIVNHSQSIGSQSYNLQYTFNLSGQLVSETYPSGKVVTNTIDNYGVIQSVADSQRTYLSSVTLNNQGLRSQINLGNGTSETFSYNDRFQLTSQSLLKGSEVLQKYEYSFGQITLSDGSVDATKNNGQIAKIESYIGSAKQSSQRFAYDELSRLSEAREYKSGDNSHLSYKQKFDFDRFGNLYRKAANNPTSGQENPLAYTAIEDSDVSKSTNRFTSNTTYDEAGQVTADNKFRNMGFSYDANGRLVKATKTNTPDALTIYDGWGNRVGTKVLGTWQYSIYDVFGLMIAEYGALSEGPGGVKFIQQDSQGSVRTATNSNGFVVARTDHQAFGEEIGVGVGLRSIDQGYNADPVTAQGYGLTKRDEGTGQQSTWLRNLETRAGRWSSPDPYNGAMNTANSQSFNKYSYVQNDPVNYIDPSGMERNELCDASMSYELCIYLAGGFFGGGPPGGTFYRSVHVNDELSAFAINLYFTPYFSESPGGGGGGTCGVNPITGGPGLNPVNSGIPGELRPGNKGGGQFGAPRSSGVPHRGDDISAPVSTPVFQFAPGRVSAIIEGGNYGLMVIIDHGNGYTSRYAHLSSTLGLKVGDVLDGRWASQIGASGRAGNASKLPEAEMHLHFEIRLNGVALNPEDILNAPCPKGLRDFPSHGG